MHVSLDLAEACLDRLRTLPQGPVNVKLPKVLRVPEGDLYTATENPLGFNGYYLVSRGEKTPWRLKLRSASFNNVAVLAEVLPGNLIADMVAILGLDVLRGRRRRQVAQRRQPHPHPARDARARLWPPFAARSGVSGAGSGGRGPSRSGRRGTSAG